MEDGSPRHSKLSYNCPYQEIFTETSQGLGSRSRRAVCPKEAVGRGGSDVMGSVGHG
jgi:hypothetical protein